jgi:Domain of unknown function (DUF4160)
MPELCRFYGIIIRMFWEDHSPPHFHAIYGHYEALVDIRSSEIIAGSLPLGAHSLVRQWSDLHRDELLDDWELASSLQPLKRIEPLP